MNDPNNGYVKYIPGQKGVGSKTASGGYKIFWLEWNGSDYALTSEYVLTPVKIHELGEAIAAARKGASVPIHVVDGTLTITVDRSTGADGRRKVTLRFGGDPAEELDDDARPWQAEGVFGYTTYAELVAIAWTELRWRGPFPRGYSKW